MNIHSSIPPIETAGSAGYGRTRASTLAGALNLRRLAITFRKRLRLFVAVVATIFIAMALVTFNETPKYTAVAKVMLDTRKEQITNVQEVLSGIAIESSAVDTEVEVIRSRQLAERVVKSLKLDQDPDFNPALPGRSAGPVDTLKASIKALLGRAPKAQPVVNALDAQKQREVVVDRVLGGLSVRRAGVTYVIDVAYQSPNPAKAAEIANKFAELYLLEQLEAKFDATRQATEWLNSRLGELRVQVLRDDAAVQQYKIANNLLSASGSNLTEQEIYNYNTTLAEARTLAAEDAARLRTAREQLAGGSTGDDVGEALSSPVIQELRKSRTVVSAQLADLQGRYGERHPEMLKARRQLSDIDTQIQQEIGRIVSNLQAKAQVSEQRAATISGSLGAARGVLASNNRAMVRLNELQRNADASRTLYESYLNRFKETTTQQGLEQSDSRVVSKARIPTAQSSPNVNLNLLVGLMLALGAGLIAVLVAENLDAGLTTAEDVESRLETAFLGSIPLLSSVSDDSSVSPAEHVVKTPFSAYSEAFRNLRASILYARLGEPVKVVAITSALPGEGKTTTSICLGRTAALQGSKVILVDCDLRRQAVKRFLKEDQGPGLLEVLNGEVKLDQAISVDAESGAHLLPVAQSMFTPRDVFGTQAMDHLLEELRGRYDLVILDTAPVLPVADTRILAPKADVVIFLARWRKTPQDAIESAFRMLGGTGAHVAGVVLSQVDMNLQAKYGYGDSGYYYGAYKKYYA